MFNYIKGYLAEITPLYCVIECSGVGYEIEIPVSTYERIRTAESIKLFVHHYQNDEGVRLFGFYTIEEKELFRKLISISRVGPKIALSLLSALPVSSIISSILSDDYVILSKVPGMGKKTAQRLIIELKDKVGNIETTDNELNSSAINNVAKQAEEALLTLGYKPLEIRKVFKYILNDKPDMGLEELIKNSIKALYKKG